MANPLCFALDVPSADEAARYVQMLEPHVGAFKVGLELFIASRGLPKTERPIVLDLKLHDIPETVARAIKASCDLGAKYLTLHVQQRATLEEAAKTATSYGVTLLGVTVLTSMTADDLKDLGSGDTDVEYRVYRQARFAKSCGIQGFVCSPGEAKGLRQRFADSFLLVPGIRSSGSSQGDQQRVGTPSQAVRDGANLIVVGRPIRDAVDPVAATRGILEEVGCLK